jgi:prepilin-type N-terminal cleavage/methylation domain-containing protein/prepilin-type processing-associated H-X9-DG protein
MVEQRQSKGKWRRARRQVMIGMQSQNNRRPGFTLIELLVVVAILGLLMSILLPSLRSAKVSAKRVVCGTNLRQLGVAMQSYLNENGDRFPRASIVPSLGSFPLNTEMPVYIADVLAPHTNNNEKVFQCPADLPGRVDRPGLSAGYSYYETERSSYEYRARLGGRTIAEVSNRTERFIGDPVPDNTIWVMRDYHNFHRKSGKATVSDDPFNDENSPDAVGQRNYLYSDGHVSDFENY